MGFRIALTGAIAMVAVSIVAGFFRLLRRFHARRGFRRQIRPGDEMTSTFGPSSVALTGRLASSELSCTGFDSIKREGSWIYFRYGGVAVSQACPADLFPEHELGRLANLIGVRRGT